MTYNSPLEDPSLVACHQCDLVQHLPDLVPGQSARCLRCNHELWRCRHDSLNRTFALTVGAAIIYVLANTMPMLGLSVAGRHAATTVFGGAQQLWNDGEQIVAGVVFLAAIVAPGVQILLLLAIVAFAHRGRLPHQVGALMRYHPISRTWSMIEVMLLGVLVALIKSAELATVIPGIALFALGALVFVFAAIQSCFDSREIWERMQWVCEETRHPGNADSRLPAAAGEQVAT